MALPLLQNRTDGCHSTLCACNAEPEAAALAPSACLLLLWYMQACDRGGYVFQDKWNEASRVGAQLMVIMNVPGGNQTVFDLDLQLPYLHLTVAQRQALLTYVSTAGAAAKATLEVAQFKLGRTAPAMASFSSRGPIPIANAVLMKPDITAPGGIAVVEAPSVGQHWLLGVTVSLCAHLWQYGTCFCTSKRPCCPQAGAPKVAMHVGWGPALLPPAVVYCSQPEFNAS